MYLFLKKLVKEIKENINTKQDLVTKPKLCDKYNGRNKVFDTLLTSRICKTEG